MRARWEAIRPGIIILSMTSCLITAVWAFTLVSDRSTFSGIAQSERAHGLETLSRMTDEELVDLLGSNHPEVVLATIAQLEQRVEQRQQLPGIDVASDMIQLLEALNRDIPEVSPTTQARLAPIIRRLSSWELDPAHASQFRLQLENLVRQISTTTALAEVQHSPQQLAEHTWREDDGVRPVPDMISRFELSAGPEISPVNVPTIPASVKDVELERSVEHDTSPGIHANQSESISAPGQFELRPQNSARPVQSVPMPQGTMDQMQELSNLQIIWKLHSEPQVSQTARECLKLRGFTESDTRLAERLAHPDVQVRLELAQELPRMQGIDPSNWLLWMTKDPSAAVRYSAVTALLTASDPQLLRQLHIELQNDPSSRIRRLFGG